jgi:hypothetical protein
MDRRKRVMDKAYIVWTCRRGRCEPVTTRMKDDVRLYQFAPRDGDSDLARFRQAFLLRRSAVETVFSVLGYFGVGDKAQRRIKWGGDIDMEWVVSLACLFMTGRRLVHEMGLYTAAYEEAIAEGLLRRPPWGTDSPWPVERSEGEDGSEPLPQAGVGGVGPAGRHTRGEQRNGVEGTARVRRARRGRPRSVRRARMLGSTPLDLLVASNLAAARRAEPQSDAEGAHDEMTTAEHEPSETEAVEGAHGDETGATTPQDWSVPLEHVTCQGGIAEPVSWRGYLRRRDASEAAPAASAGEPQVRRDGGQVQPEGTAFVDDTARRRLLADVGEFEFCLLVDMQDNLDADRRGEPRWDDVARGRGIGHDDLVTVTHRGVVELSEDTWRARA